VRAGCVRSIVLADRGRQEMVQAEFGADSLASESTKGIWADARANLAQLVQQGPPDKVVESAAEVERALEVPPQTPEEVRRIRTQRL
jgi:hypothetical protein